MSERNLAAQISDLDTMLARIPKLAEQANIKVRRSKEITKRLDRAEISQEIGGGLGVVIVNGRGQLKSVDLNAGELRLVDTRVFGEHIVRAIRTAEKKASELREAVAERERGK